MVVFTISRYRCCIIDVRVFISLEIIPSEHKTQVEFRSHFSGKKCVLWAWKYGNRCLYKSKIWNGEHCNSRRILLFYNTGSINTSIVNYRTLYISLQKARGTTSLCGPWAALHFLAFIFYPPLETCVEKLWRMQGFVCKRLWGKTVVTLNMFFIRNNFPAYED